MSCQIEDDDGDWSAPVMLIMRGNSAPAGVYEDENGNKPAWPKGAMHEGPAREYAVLKGFKPKVLDVTGSSKGGDRDASDGTLMALECFQKHPTVTAFYGFSGGGYNLKHILDYLAAHKPETLYRIDLVVVLGAPLQPKIAYESPIYNAVARRKIHRANWKPVQWNVVYKTNPPKSALPEGLPKNTGTHMFGSDALLAETPAGRYRDWPLDDD